MKRFLVLAVVLGLIGIGCAQRKVTTAGDTASTTPTAEQKAAAEREAAAKGAEKVTEQKMAKVEAKDLPGAKADEVAGMFPDIHFDFDKYDIKDNDKPTLKQVADYLIKNGADKLLIEGHCDDRGTNEYNLGLGDRRAKATRDYLISLGVPSARMNMISYGEERPLCKEQNEACWSKNRRSHFVVVKGKK